MFDKKDYAISKQELMEGPYNTVKLQLRILNSVSGSSILGVILEENEDSFLVAAPSRLVSYEKELKIEPYVPVPWARFFKSTILSVTATFNEFEIHYIKFLISMPSSLFNELFKPVHMEFLQSRLKELKESDQKEEPESVLLGKGELPSEDSFLMLSDSKYKH